ncbi:MAG: hypothetical protein ABEJ79_07755 [Halolamina sp.]
MEIQEETGGKHADVLDRPGSVLLLSPSLSGDEDAACADLMRPTSPADQNVLWVSYTKSPDTQLDRFREAATRQPSNVGIVSVEDSTRSVSASNTDGGIGGGPVDTVSSPNDLTGVGISITEFLQRWTDNDHRTVVCFDSLTAMLQYTDIETAYEFLHVIVSRIYATDAVAHFHMDPGAHDDQTVAQVCSLMDAVIELDDDGASVRNR